MREVLTHGDIKHKATSLTGQSILTVAPLPPSGPGGPCVPGGP